MSLLVLALFLSGDWNSLNGLTPGQRVIVEHQGKLQSGIYAYSRPDEIVITTVKDGEVRVPKIEVDTVTVRGTESPKLGFWGNLRDQLWPAKLVVYEKPKT